MARWNKSVITNIGKQMLAEAAEGSSEIEFVKVSIGSGSYGEGENEVAFLEEQTDLKEPQNEYGISSIERTSIL